jgi:hypothetical protein
MGHDGQLNRKRCESVSVSERKKALGEAGEGSSAQATSSPTWVAEISDKAAAAAKTADVVAARQGEVAAVARAVGQKHPMATSLQRLRRRTPCLQSAH